MAYTTIDDPTIYFNTITYSGNASNPRTLTGVGFQPDWVWQKNRTDSNGHTLADAVRGANKTLSSDGEGVEVTDKSDGHLDAFTSDGFTVGAGSSSDARVNDGSHTYIAYNWLGANGTASNSNGTITSTVSANASAGFSIVSYTGNGNSSQTVGHGLGTTPAWIIVKNRDQTDKWSTFHQSLPNGSNSYIELDQNGGSSNLSLSPPYWGTPSSTTFGGLHFDSTNASGEKYIAYCFAEKKGYSKFGSYTGNGNTNDDGVFVYLGFRPAWVVVKRHDAAENWVLFDNKLRPANNVGNNFLYPDLANAVDTSADFDMLSNGFKTRTASNIMNGSGSEYIYMAFAESPLVNSNGVPATAR